MGKWPSQEEMVEGAQKQGSHLFGRPSRRLVSLVSYLVLDSERISTRSGFSDITGKAASTRRPTGVLEKEAFSLFAGPPKRSQTC